MKEVYIEKISDIGNIESGDIIINDKGIEIKEYKSINRGIISKHTALTDTILVEKYDWSFEYKTMRFTKDELKTMLSLLD